MSSKFLFNAQTTNANGTPVETNFSTYICEVQVYGTFDSASFTLQSSPDRGVTWITVTDLNGAAVTITSAQMIPVNVVYNEYLRGVLSGGGGSMSITAKLREVGRG